MTYARSQLVSDTAPGFYHCVSRCVRRAFLCGKDHYTGRSYEHRKGWVEDRLHTLAQAFSVSIYAYAVMSNHLHVVVRVDPTAVADWTDEEVARRWTHAYAGQYGDVPEQAVLDARVEQLLQQPDRLFELRARLGSLSWFMRALNEPIARMANREDHCTGHFWEGRFKSQVLLDEQAVLSCMAYVDLNPVRAGICDTLEDSDHTSIQKRLTEAPEQKAASLRKKKGGEPLGPLIGLRAAVRLSISQAAYIDLVEWTGRHSRPDKRGRLHKSQQTANVRNRHPWLTQVLGTETRFYRAIGSPSALRAAAESIGQHWLKGVRLAFSPGT
jgi:REP element-mobilizing transposase RayT